MATERVPVLTDKNWAHWNVVRAVLLEKKAWGVVGGTETLAADAGEAATTAFVAKQHKALGTIIPAVSEKLTHFIPSDAEDPRVIWNNLKDHFESKSAFNVFAVQNKLAHLLLPEKTEPGPWLHECMQLYDSLAVLGRTVSDADQCMATLTMLSDSYSALVTSLTTQLAQGALSMTQLSEFIENYHRTTRRSSRRKPEAHSDSEEEDFREEQSLKASSGHKSHKRDNHHGRSPPGEKSQGKQLQCYRCGGIGHVKRVCPSAPPDAARWAVHESNEIIYDLNDSDSDPDSDGVVHALSASVLKSRSPKSEAHLDRSSFLPGGGTRDKKLAPMSSEHTANKSVSRGAGFSANRFPDKDLPVVGSEGGVKEGAKHLLKAKPRREGAAAADHRSGRSLHCVGDTEGDITNTRQDSIELSGRAADYKKTSGARHKVPRVQHNAFGKAERFKD